MVFPNRSPFFSYGEQHAIGKSQRSIQYIYIYICMYICMYMYICIYIYIWYSPLKDF